MEEQRSAGLYFMCAITMFFIMSCITFMTYGVKQSEQEMMDYYASPLTQEEIDASWQKFENRNPSEKKVKDSIDKGR
jgi:hypothetical protein